jgi:phosphate:Na+ symporter
LNIWEFLAGLGIFLFGMFLLEESVRLLSGKAFKNLIRKYTEGRIKSILSGTLATAILQSSSAVSLMVLAFAGAGIMSMPNAIGVILGSNIGTTLTSWIVATAGFKVNIEAFSLPFIAIGGLGLIFFGKSGKATNLSKLLVGFGFLFMGLDYMKRSMDFLASEIDLHYLADYGTIAFIIAGFTITAIVQSSSASMAIILSAVFSKLIPFETAAAMVIGTNLGTTVTVLLGAIGAAAVKRRVAFSHFFFNLFTGIVALLILPLLQSIFTEIFNLDEGPVIGLAIFHTAFNVFGVLLFLPFISLFARFIEKIVPDKKSEITLYINKVNPELIDVAEAQLTAVRNEAVHLTERVLMFNLKLFSIDEKLVINEDVLLQENFKKSLVNQYSDIKQLQANIFAYAASLQGIRLSEMEGSELHRILHAVRHSVTGAKILKDISHNLDEIDAAGEPFLSALYHELRKKMMFAATSVFSIMNENENNRNIPEMVKLNEKIQKEEEEFMFRLTDALKDKKISETYLPQLLNINRALSENINQILNSIKELKLNERESELYENFEDKSEVVDIKGNETSLRSKSS